MKISINRGRNNLDPYRTLRERRYTRKTFNEETLQADLGLIAQILLHTIHVRGSNASSQTFALSAGLILADLDAYHKILQHHTSTNLVWSHTYFQRTTHISKERSLKRRAHIGWIFQHQTITSHEQGQYVLSRPSPQAPILHRQILTHVAQVSQHQSSTIHGKPQIHSTRLSSPVQITHWQILAHIARIS